jgi:ribosomal protein S18 acetylase RimI-like enzyme
LRHPGNSDRGPITGWFARGEGSGQDNGVTLPAADAAVRPARVGDAAAIAEVMVTSWRTTFAALLPAAQVAELDLQAATEQWRVSISEPPTSDHGVLVAVAGSKVVGYVVLAPADEPDAVAGERLGELLDLVVHPEQQRRGHGSRLLSAAAAQLRERGVHELLTWTAERDSVRTKFLASAGLEPDGAFRVLDVDGSGAETLRQIRLGARL